MAHDQKRDDGAIQPRSRTLKDAFGLLGISQTHGAKLVKAGVIATIWLGPATRRITEAEIQRILREGIPRDALRRA